MCADYSHRCLPRVCHRCLQQIGLFELALVSCYSTVFMINIATDFEKTISFFTYHAGASLSMHALHVICILVSNGIHVYINKD